MAIFVIQYFSFLGPTICGEVVSGSGIGAIEVTLNVQKGMTASILNMAASTYIILEGVMLAQWLRERDERKREERLEKIRGHAAEEVKEWRAWYERMKAAQREGLHFDEPPPGQKRDVKEER